MPPSAIRTKLAHRQPGQDFIDRQPVQRRVHEPAVTTAIAHHNVTSTPGAAAQADR